MQHLMAADQMYNKLLFCRYYDNLIRKLIERAKANGWDPPLLGKFACLWCQHSFPVIAWVLHWLILDLHERAVGVHCCRHCSVKLCLCKLKILMWQQPCPFLTCSAQCRTSHQQHCHSLCISACINFVVTSAQTSHAVAVWGTSTSPAV